ncbi:MAG: ferrous iron transport protein B [Candidatus Izemoplasmatales bacterium]|nr:ferrous iron transport protein B [Candidatus Izemoplasmatales bacterium]
MSIKIVLAGNPNSGKTTLFNKLTGTNQHVGNWPGVTVEKKVGQLKLHKDVEIIDLPGIYSLSPYSLEEVISRNFILYEKIDLIINIVDGTNLERNLYLSTQLIETGIPVVLAINMIDKVTKNEDLINLQSLEKYFNVPVVGISALKAEGIDELIDASMKLIMKKTNIKPILWFSEDVEKVITQISGLLVHLVDENKVRWYSIKLFEQDQVILNESIFAKDVSREVTKIINDSYPGVDTESLIAQGRYHFIEKVNEKVFQENKLKKQKTSYKIDKILTNKWLALPIFGVLMFLIYYLSISSIGGLLTDYVNDVIFGKGGIPDILRGALDSLNASPFLEGLLIDGIVGGVGAVLGFLPQMIVLFILLAILEESGYMARIAFILDRIFRRFGLSGQSFIPMLISTGCAIPGIMASRTIKDEQSRKMTIMTTSFMPCGAKLPIIALIAGALFSNSPIQWLIAPSAYFFGILAILISGIALRKFKAFAGDPAPFIMELPDYSFPRLKSICFQVWNKLKSFIIKAGTVVLAASIGIWFLSAFDLSLRMVEDVDSSILASVGKFIQIIFAPLGWGNWKAAVATFMGLVAKENVVGTFGVLYGFAEVGENGAEIWSFLTNDFTSLSAYSFLLFNLICAPCFAAIGAIRREIGSAKWTWIAVLYQTLLAYTLSLIFYQIGLLFTGAFTAGTIVGIIALGILVYLIFIKKRPKHNEI